MEKVIEIFDMGEHQGTYLVVNYVSSETFTAATLDEIYKKLQHKI